MSPLAMPEVDQERDLDQLLSTIHEEAVACEILPNMRHAFCRQLEDHDADLRILWSCSCVSVYCDSAFGAVSKSRMYCSAHTIEGKPNSITVLLTEPIR